MSDTQPKQGILTVLCLYLIATFLWRALIAAHEYPSPALRNLTIGLDLLCLIGLVGIEIQIFKNDSFQSIGGKILFWCALLAGLGLFAIRLNGNASWWTGHLMYNLPPRS
jgi:hypothetical protein